MYPYISKWRDEVLDKTKQQGYIEMGLGSRIICDNIHTDGRTIFNSQSQFWSVLTLIALAKMHNRIEEEGMQDKVLITNTIYDAIYMEVQDDPQTIIWANKTLVDCMNVDFIENQIVPNDAECELSINLSHPLVISKTATDEEVLKTLQIVKTHTQNTYLTTDLRFATSKEVNDQKVKETFDTLEEVIQWQGI